MLARPCTLTRHRHLSLPPPHYTPCRKQLEDLRNSTKKLSYYKRLTHVQLPSGGHHVHMVNPEGCAKAIEEWTAANPE